MNINSRPLSLNMLANVDKFAGRLGCLEERFYLGCLACLEEMPWGGGFAEGRFPWLLGLPRKMPSGSGFEGDYFGCRGCLEEMPLGGGFEGDYFGRRVASK